MGYFKEIVFTGGDESHLIRPTVKILVRRVADGTRRFSVYMHSGWPLDRPISLAINTNKQTAKLVAFNAIQTWS